MLGLGLALTDLAVTIVTEDSPAPPAGFVLLLDDDTPIQPSNALSLIGEDKALLTEEI